MMELPYVSGLRLTDRGMIVLSDLNCQTNHKGVGVFDQGYLPACHSAFILILPQLHEFNG
jgi:hypothetical protein